MARPQQFAAIAAEKESRNILIEKNDKKIST